MSKKLKEMTIRPADMALIFIALILAAAVGYQAGVNKSEDKLASTQGAVQENAEPVITSKEDESKEEQLIEEEVQVESADAAEVAQAEESTEQAKPETAPEKPAYISITASASDEGDLLSISADLGALFSGVCKFKLVKVGYEEKIHKESLVDSLSYCSIQIPQDEVGLVGEWQYSVNFVSNDKKLEGSSGVKVLTVY